MQNDSDFLIVNGILTEYRGTSTRRVVVPFGVRKIGMRAFCRAKGVSCIVLPSSVTEIGSYAFDSCRSLRSVEFPPYLTRIGEWAFSSCVKLASVEIPSGVKVIERGAFSGCRALTSVRLPSDLAVIGYRAFYYCVKLASLVVPSRVTLLDERAFELCGSLATLRLESDRTRIGAYAFYGCESLRAFLCHGEIEAHETSFSLCPLDLSAAAMRIPLSGGHKLSAARAWLAGLFEATPADEPLLVEYARRHKTLLFKCITEDLNASAFVRLSEVLTTRIDPESLDAALAVGAGNGEFTAVLLEYKKKNYTLAELDRRETIAMEKAFGLRPLNVAEYRKMFALSESGDGYVVMKYKGEQSAIAIPEKIGKKPVVGIGNSAFYNRTDLTSVKLPATIRTIGRYAFSGCVRLQSVELPSSLEKIEYRAFAETALKRVTIPASVSEIEKGAFEDCKRLTSAVFRSRSLTVRAFAFSVCYALDTVTAIGSGVVFEASAFPSFVREIIAPAASPAETYAAKNGIKFTALSGSEDV
ncbi:MAG: leucine-rich repeat protein [Clostridia bacterium]|nr:leucine-rich repeat protein [Clostridia bacterium]